MYEFLEDQIIGFEIFYGSRTIHIPTSISQNTCIFVRDGWRSGCRNRGWTLKRSPIRCPIELLFFVRLPSWLSPPRLFIHRIFFKNFDFQRVASVGNLTFVIGPNLCPTTVRDRLDVIVIPLISEYWRTAITKWKQIRTLTHRESGNTKWWRYDQQLNFSAKLSDCRREPWKLWIASKVQKHGPPL